MKTSQSHRSFKRVQVFRFLRSAKIAKPNPTLKKIMWPSLASIRPSSHLSLSLSASPVHELGRGGDDAQDELQAENTVEAGFHHCHLGRGPQLT